jgi:hypothetical protein
MPGNNTLELVQAVYTTGWAFQRRCLKEEVKVDRIDDGTEKIIHLVRYQVDNWPGFDSSHRLSVKLTKCLVNVEQLSNISTPLLNAAINIYKNVNGEVIVEALWGSLGLELSTKEEEYVENMLPKFAGFANFIYAGYCKDYSIETK